MLDIFLEEKGGGVPGYRAVWRWPSNARHGIATKWLQVSLADQRRDDQRCGHNKWVRKKTNKENHCQSK